MIPPRPEPRGAFALDTLAALDVAIQNAAPEERAGLVVQLAARLATLGASLAASTGRGAQPVREEAERLLTPEQAAEVAAVPVARIYSWARGARWAQRPSRRCLRISERSFRRWLASRC